MSSVRKLVLAVDHSEECKRALAWLREHLYKPGDELILLHVLPQQSDGLANASGAPPVDILTVASPLPQSELVRQAQQLIENRFLPSTLDMSPSPTVRIVTSKVDAESIGAMVVRTADEVHAAAIVIASHSRTRLQEFYLGSTTNYITAHSQRPVLVVH